MKNIFKSIALMLLTAVITTACEERVLQTDPVSNYAAVISTTLSIIPNESGTVQAFIGDEITAQGINLEYVSKVEFYHSSSSTTAEATITNLDHTNIAFVIPYFAFEQSDQSYPVSLYIYDVNVGDETPIFSYSYYIAVPVTDVVVDSTTPIAPAEGTVGDEITITGRNLGQVSAITFAGVTISYSDFVEHLAESITFAIPEGTYDEGTSSVAVSMTWSGGDVSVSDEFTMKTPKFDSYVAPSVTPILSDQITLTGENLDLVSGYMWGDYSLSVVGEVTSESVTLQIPSIMDIDQTAGAEITKDITAVYGSPEQAVTAAAAVTIDTTKLEGAVPEIASITVVDGGDAEPYKFYLGKEVTLSGSALSLIESITVGGVEATTVSQSDSEYIFTVPYSTTMGFDQTSEVTVDDIGYTFDTATEMTVTLSYSEGIVMDVATIMVYPMYYYKDVCLGLGTSSSSYYTAYAHDNSFFMLNDGRVLSATEWYDDEIDIYAKGNSSNALLSGTNTLATTATMEEYYSVEPYILVYSDSSGKVTLGCGANSASSIKCHRYTSDYSSYSSVSSTMGTPIVGFRNITDTSDDAYMDIMAGTLEAFNEKNDTSTGGPALTTAGSEQGSTSTFGEGSVMFFGYATYSYGVAKANPAAEARRAGYIHITEVTCADTTTGKFDFSDAQASGYLKFDAYITPERHADK